MDRAITANDRKLAALGTPWERTYGYAQGVRVKDTIYVAGQLSHDAGGNFIGAPSSEQTDAATARSNMDLQMRTTYTNAARVLAQFGAGLHHVVEEVLYVTDMDAAIAVAGDVRRAAYAVELPSCASTIVQVMRLAFPQQLVEISLTAVLPD